MQLGHGVQGGTSRVGSREEGKKRCESDLGGIHTTVEVEGQVQKTFNEVEKRIYISGV